MKCRILTCIAAMTALVALALSIRLSAQQAVTGRINAKPGPCRASRLEAFDHARASGVILNTSSENRTTPFCSRNCRHYGYCEATYTKGQWLTDGLCTSHNFSFCDIQPSSACPNGAMVKQLPSDSCGGVGSDEVDMARTCSF